ncbi:MAG: hypothetical protein HN368_10360 [Spirochaetales bacterium]|jgi:hypothetical protein|nr:hypothetical protein [Spirochaetales bacterium]
MNDRERFLACLSREPVDRPPYWLFWGAWDTTYDRWKKEGLPENLERREYYPWIQSVQENRITEVNDYRKLFEPDSPPLVVPVNCGPCPVFDQGIIEESDEYVVYIDSWGIKRRDIKKNMSMSEFLQHPVTDRKSWEKFKVERLDPDNPDRLAGDWRERCASWMAKGYPIQLGYCPDVTLFGGIRWLFGVEECLIAFYTMPDLLHEIMDHLTSLYLTIFERVVEHVRVDVIHIWEDLCGRQGSLISPEHWDEFLAPNYLRIKKFADEHNIPFMSVDTDGNPETIIPSMMRAGVNYLWPMEVTAGCDISALQRKYAGLGMMGGIDKRALASGPREIDDELERIRAAISRGGYVPALDHGVPDDVSWNNYKYFAEGLKSIVGKR